MGSTSVALIATTVRAKLNALAPASWLIRRTKRAAWIACQMLLRWLFLLTALLAPLPLDAQGGGHQYCAEFYDGSPPDCAYSTLQICEQSVTGVGGICTESLGQAVRSPTSFTAAVPPPPFAQPPSKPLTLPDAVQPQPCNPVIDGTYCASAGDSSASTMQSLSSDLAIRGDDAATFGGITFSGSGSACIGLFRRIDCGG
jgi:hypothetical protein